MFQEGSPLHKDISELSVCECWLCVLVAARHMQGFVAIRVVGLVAQDGAMRIHCGLRDCLSHQLCAHHVLRAHGTLHHTCANIEGMARQATQRVCSRCHTVSPSFARTISSYISGQRVLGVL